MEEKLEALKEAAAMLKVAMNILNECGSETDYESIQGLIEDVGDEAYKIDCQLQDEARGEEYPGEASQIRWQQI